MNSRLSPRYRPRRPAGAPAAPPGDVHSLNARAAALLQTNASLARSLAEQATALAGAGGDAAGRLQALRNLGSACHRLGDLRAAVGALAQGLDAARLQSDRPAEMVCANGIAASLSCLGDLDGALDYFLRALALAKALEDGPAVAKTLGNIGFVYEAFGDAHKALAHYRSAYREKRSLALPLGMALMNLACIYDRLDRPRRALRLFAAALQALRHEGDRENESHALAALALTSNRLGDSAAALTAINAALGVAREFGLKRQEARALARLGDIHRQQRDPVAAREAFTACLALADAAGFSGEMRSAWAGLAAVLHELGDPAAAEAAARAADLERSLALQRQAAHTETLSLRADVERLQRELARTRRRAIDVVRQNRQLSRTNRQLRDGLKKSPSIGAPRHDVAARLSQREQEVLAMLVRGLSNDAIGRQLGMSPNTARTHVASIFRKLGVRTRAQVIALALGSGR